jgi:hypothetical protein
VVSCPTLIYHKDYAVKDFLEPFLFPQNIFLWLFFFACLHYRRKGLWLLLLWFYLTGNTLIANQVRDWYNSQISSAALPAHFAGDYVLLGCGGNADSLPDCASNRIHQLSLMLNTQQRPATVFITTLHCEPYEALLKQKTDYASIHCFDGGPTTYHEFISLDQKLDKGKDYLFISSDYHALRVKKLAQLHQVQASVYAAASSTFRPVNCGWNCLLTVNLSNYDLYSKLFAETASLQIYSLTHSWTDWYQ